MAILGAKQGKINFLRVHDAGGWGPPSDFIDVECVIRFLGEPDKAYGFQLRVDPHGKSSFLVLSTNRADTTDIASDGIVFVWIYHNTKTFLVYRSINLLYTIVS
jgi:hypothetical protein